MKALEVKIKKEGKVFPGEILKIDNFLNHQIDTRFLDEIGQEFRRLFDKEVTKILTIEASGIAIATATARYYDFCPVLFAKKIAAANMSDAVYSAELFSYTRKQTFYASVAKEYLNENDKVLIIDDFLANGEALNAMVNLCKQAGAEIVGCGIVVEKGYQPGGRKIREMGIDVQSLAIVSSMTDDSIEFADQPL